MPNVIAEVKIGMLDVAWGGGGVYLGGGLSLVGQGIWRH
jgi:hypothetical protein